MSGPESMKPDDQLFDEFLAGQGPVRETYSAMAQEQAPANLDAAILNMAQAAARPLPRARRSRWQMPMAAAAVVVLSFGVLLEVQRDPAVQQELMAPPDQAAPSVGSPAEAVADGAAPEALAVTKSALEEAAVEKKQAAVAAVRPKPAPRADQRAAAPPPPPVMAAAPPPAAAPVPQQAEPADAPAAEAESFERAAALGAMAEQSMQRRERSVAPVAKAQASRSSAAAFAAPAAESPPEVMADAQSSSASPACPVLQAGQQPVIGSAATAIVVARPLLIRRFGAEVMAGYEPLKGEPSGALWLVKGTLPLGVTGSAPEVELCAATGTALRIQPAHKAE